MSELKLTFDTTLSDALNIHIMKPKIIDLSILMGQSFALDDFGLAYEVVSNSRWARPNDSSRSRPCPWSWRGADAMEEV